MTGKELRLERIRNDLRQVDVAEQAGLSRQRVSALERRGQLTANSAERMMTAISRAAAGDRARDAEVIVFPRAGDS